MLLFGGRRVALAITIFAVQSIALLHHETTNQVIRTLTLRPAGQNDWHSCCEHRGVQLLLLFQATEEWRPFIWYHLSNVNHPRQDLYWKRLSQWIRERNVTIAIASFVNRPDPGYGVGAWGNHGDLAPSYAYRLHSTFTSDMTSIMQAIGNVWIDSRASLTPTLSSFEAIVKATDDPRDRKSVV